MAPIFKKSHFKRIEREQ